MNNTNKTLEFNKIYKEQIFPILRNYEVYRQREYKKHIIYVTAIILAVVLILCSWLLGCLSNFILSHDEYFIFFSLAPIIICVLIYFYTSHINKKNKTFTNTLKVNCMGKMLEIFGDIKWQHKDTAKYHTTKVISDYTIQNCGLFLDYNHREDDDCFYGTYEGVPFKILETHIWAESGSGKTRQVITAHKGVIIEFQTDKHTKNRTIIQTKGDITAKQAPYIFTILTVIGSIQEIIKSGLDIFVIILSLIVIVIVAVIEFSHSKKQEPLNKVTLEDPIFNKRFDVYSSDQTEARYMITTAFMERFYNIKTTFNAKNIKCSFIGDNLIIALQTNKNLFEIGNLYKSLESPESINDFYNELSSILKMVEYFKLDEKTRL